ncbi:MFS transporter [Catellatospora tritici]|uniref:MFS transporter n=1 Tax=Catellatospora tritici TaxID=2851566 RepID=UPI001C2D6CC3|nr:MFS transporter [Catellatospora tritici]MBV1856561.1 MFS transporter [Catellatospora tritici]
MTTIAKADAPAGSGLTLLVGSKFASTVAYSILWVLLPLYVYQSSGSALAAAVASAVNVVPFLLFGMLAGAYVDRSSPARVMVWMETANAAVLLSVPLLDATVGLPPLVLILVGFVSATVYVWFEVASSATIPAVVGKSGVFRANSWLWMISTLVTSVAAPVGFFLLDALRLGPTFAVLAGCYLVSALLIALLRLPRPTRAEPGTREPGAIWAGLRFIADQPLLRAYTTVNVGVGVSAGAVYGMLVVFSSRALGLATDDYRMAWIMTAAGAGALIGAITARRLKTAPPVPTARWLIGADLVLLLAYAAAPNWAFALVALLAWNSVHTCFMVVGISVRQIVTPLPLQGRVNAVGRMIAWGSVPLGTLLCGWLTDLIGPRQALAVLAACALASLIVALRTPRTLTTEEAPR